MSGVACPMAGRRREVGSAVPPPPSAVAPPPKHAARYTILKLQFLYSIACAHSAGGASPPAQWAGHHMRRGNAGVVFVAQKH